MALSVEEEGDAGTSGSDRSARPNTPAAVGTNLRVSVCAHQGGRKYMEDRVHIECVRTSDSVLDYTYVAVYDGHGGAEASEFVRRNLLKNIQAQSGFDGNDSQMLAAIKAGFIETHNAMWKVVGEWPLTASGYTSTAGTTASCAFIRRGKVFTGHVGDSAIILGRKDDESITPICLTVDHKPDSFEEEQRINASGGMIMKKSGVMRVVWTRPIRGHVGPVRRSTPTESIAFLAVARALGDLWSYNRETKRFVVSPEPDVCVYELDGDDRCIVLGSDGLTNVLKPQQIVNVLANYELVGCDKEGRLPNHSRWLLREALRGWGALRADNITVVTVMLDNASEWESYSESALMKRDVDMDLEEVFTSSPSCLVRVGAEYSEQYETTPIDLIYNGAMDQQNFFIDIDYKGPGFTPCENTSKGLTARYLAGISPTFGIRRCASTAFMGITAPSTAAAPEVPTLKSALITDANNRKVFENVAEGGESMEPSSTSDMAVCGRDTVSAETPPTLDTTTDEQQAGTSITSSGANDALAGVKRRNPAVELQEHAGVCESNVVRRIHFDEETGQPVKFYCRKHGLKCTKVKRFNDEFAARQLASRRSEAPFENDVNDGEEGDTESHNFSPLSDAQHQQQQITPPPNTRKKVLEEHAYASSTSKPVAIVSPITTTPISGRKRLVAVRRAPMLTQRRRSSLARRNLSMREELRNEGSENRSESVLGNELKEDEEDQEEVEGDDEKGCERAAEDSTRDMSPSLHDLITAPRNDPPIPIGPRRSFGGASALSPALMLQAMRTPDRLAQGGARDPLARDVTLSGLRIFRSQPVYTPSSLTSLERLSIGDSAVQIPLTTQNETAVAPMPVGSVQKRKAMSVDSSVTVSEPPPKRSRIWGFLTNIISGSNSK